MTTETKTKSHSSQGSSVKFRAEQNFDSKKMRHYLNGKVSVLHCHHYATLFTQLALDAEDLKGPQLLEEATCECFEEILRDYYRENSQSDISDRISIAEQYFSFIGLGEVELQFAANEGVAVMKHSHVDDGWTKKWGRTDKPVNLIGQGYLKAAWAAIYDRTASDVKVKETQSIVSGASTSRFTLSW